MSKNHERHESDPGPEHPIRRLRWIMETLRNPDRGCPWDLEQTHKSLKPYLLEEACEVLDAIDSGDDEEFCKELGDLLLQIVFHAQMASERGAFGLDEVAAGICEKLLLRHPHVFADADVDSARQVLQNWESIKLKNENKSCLLEGVPRSLPALLSAFRMQEKASSIGFDWKTPAQVVPKIREEVEEFIAAFEENDSTRVEEEFGDLLFSLVNLARLAGINAEFSLVKSCAKFRRRFTLMEKRIKDDAGDISDLSLEEMDAYWNSIKDDES